jgi:hypothetical protein
LETAIEIDPKITGNSKKISRKGEKMHLESRQRTSKIGALPSQTG